MKRRRTKLNRLSDDGSYLNSCIAKDVLLKILSMANVSLKNAFNMSLVCKKWAKCFRMKPFWESFLDKLLYQQVILRSVGKNEWQSVDDPRYRNPKYNLFPVQLWGPEIEAKSAQAVKDVVKSKPVTISFAPHKGYCTFLHLNRFGVRDMIEYTEMIGEYTYIGLVYDKNFEIVYFGQVKFPANQIHWEKL